MSSMTSTVLLALLGLVATVSSQITIPIPRREVGFVYNSGLASAPVHLDFYIDQICPDSIEAFPTILKVADFYGPNKLQLTTHIFPLPYHRNSFYATKGSHIFRELKGTNASYTWIQAVFDNIDTLKNTATMMLSDMDIVTKFGSIAAANGISSDTFTPMLLEGSYEMDTRIAWKYCCSRGITGTPTFLVNDVVSSSASQSWTLEDWKTLLDPLMRTAH